MTYRIELSSAARRQLRRLTPGMQARIRTRIDALAEDPRPPGCEKLAAGRGEYRIRVGDHRVIYEIHDEVLLVLVIEVGHRREIYRVR